MNKNLELVREHKPKLFMVDSFFVDKSTTVKVFLLERRRTIKQYWRDVLPPIEFEERYK